jgi:hypothetical protein
MSMDNKPKDSANSHPSPGSPEDWTVRSSRRNRGQSSRAKQARQALEAAWQGASIGDAALDEDLESAAFEPIVPVTAGAVKFSQRETRDFRDAVEELARRQKEALRLYRPMDQQDAFHASRAPIRMIRGGNRGGKTLGAAVECARAITGIDPYNKFTKKNGRAIFVGKNLLHCSKVMFRKLFRPDPFKIIRDETTGDWRPFNPSTDLHRSILAVPAPALVPDRYYGGDKSISWEDKKEEVPRSIRMYNGWEATFFSGEGAPPQGWNVDLIWMDEEIPHPLWFTEMLPRLVDNQGRLVWSATPQAGTHHLYELAQRAADEADSPNPRCQEFFISLMNNSYLSDQQKSDFIKDLGDDEDEIRVRVHGDFALAGMRIYPTLSPSGVHGCPAFEIPSDWCRAVAIDPGRQRAAALFCAIPPPGSEYYGRRILYDEIYVKNSDAKLFAKTLKQKLGDQHIHYWLLDGHMGRVTEMGSGKNIETQYAAELIAAGCADNGFKGFIWGSDDVDAGIEAIRTGLHVHEGKSFWLMQADRLRWTVWEAARYCNKKISAQNLITDQPVKRNDHLMDCWRYLAMHPLKYVKPPTRAKNKESWTTKYIKRKKAKAKQDSGWGSSIAMG